MCLCGVDFFFFLAHNRTKCPGDQNLIRHGVLMMQNSRTPDLQKTESVLVNMKSSNH